MANKDTKHKRRGSVIWGAIDRFTAFIYSFFVNGRIGEMLSSSDTLCKRSFLANRLGRSTSQGYSPLMRIPDAVMERGSISKFAVFIRGYFSSLKLNVYGTFLTFFGISSSIAVTVPAVAGGLAAIDEQAFIISAIIALCAMPLLFSSQAANEALLGSRVMSKVVLDFLCIPDEKLRIKKTYGGTGHIFVAALIGILFGALSYFISPLTVPICLIVLIAMFTVFSSPEAGVVITLALTPFMQYMKYPKMVLLFMIAITAVSYICKVFQKRRSLRLSPEISMVLLFCGFIFAAGIFSKGGFRTFVDSTVTVIIVLCGFLLTYNLVNTRKMLEACIKTLIISFLFLCVIGIWDSVYHGISNRIIDSISPNISSITEEAVLYMADKGIVFGMFVILIFPMLFAYMTGRRTVKGWVSGSVLCLLAIGAAWMCSHYEVMVALVLEFVIFWLLCSHKTLTAAIIWSFPIAIIALLYPYAVAYLGFPNISEILMEYMPASIADSEMHPSVVRDVMYMIGDGNITGIGAGDHVFSMMFPSYSSDASVGADNPMSLWLQILCWSGVFGMVAFVIFVIFLVKRSLGFARNPYNKDLRDRVLALFCGIMTALLFGSVYSIWLDERVLYLFWACVGLLMGYIKLGREHESVRHTEFKSTDDSKDVEISFND